jgi:hypothetical protein
VAASWETTGKPDAAGTVKSDAEVLRSELAEKEKAVAEKHPAEVYPTCTLEIRVHLVPTKKGRKT